MKKIRKANMLLKAVVVLGIALAFIMPVAAIPTNITMQSTTDNHPSGKVGSLMAPGTWEEQASGFATASRGIRYVHAVTPDIAWAVAYDGSGGNVMNNEFTKTLNGGTLWTAGAVLGGTTYGLGNVCGLDGNIAYVALFKDSPTQDSTCGVYKTDSGGSSWTFLGNYPVSFANNVWFWNEMEGVALGDFKDNYFEDYTTTDGGVTWTRVPQTNYSGVPWQSGEAGWTGSVAVVGENTIMFGTNKANVYISNDRGNTWVASNTGLPATGDNAGVTELTFKDPTHGLAAHWNGGGTYELSETLNGGASWELITPDGNAYDQGMAYVPGTPNTYISTGGAEGMSGASYSMDGGHTWVDFDEMIGTQMLACDFTEGGIGWAGSFNTDQTTGGMFKYTPSGIPEPELTIEAVTAGKGIINATIRNIGTAPATVVDWTITITGGLFIKNKNAVGSVLVIAPGETAEVGISSVKGIGLGIITPMPAVAITASCAEGKTADGARSFKLIFSKITFV